MQGAAEPLCFLREGCRDGDFKLIGLDQRCPTGIDRELAGIDLAFGQNPC
jgi:hypothetical protein